MWKISLHLSFMSINDWNERGAGAIEVNKKATKHVTNIKRTTHKFPWLCVLIQTTLQIDVFNVHSVNSLKLNYELINKSEANY